jgi:pimeloyl-ACP methyl ester carboxylesterase
MKGNIYFISGLGADHRLFERQVKAGIPLIILPWKIPFQHESIQSYAKRMTEEIPPSSVPVILGGVSFGGMIAIEMSKHIKVEKVILISSIKTSKELPLHIRCWKYFPIYQLLGGNFIKRTGFLIRYLFGKMNEEEIKLFLDMVKDANPVFIKWAVHQITTWQNTNYPSNTIHIHGTSDFIFPMHNLQGPLIKIAGGTHIMITTLSEKINPILEKEISKGKA